MATFVTLTSSAVDEPGPVTVNLEQVAWMREVTYSGPRNRTETVIAFVGDVRSVRVAETVTEIRRLGQVVTFVPPATKEADRT